MSPTSDARVDTEDRDPYNAEPARSDPWASGPGHLSQDDQETERFVPEQRDGSHDTDSELASEHDGHVYASDTYAEPETEVLPEGKGVSSDEPAAVGVAHVDNSEEPTAVVTHTDQTEAEAAEAEDEAEEAEIAAEEAREDAATVDDTYEPTADDESESRPEPIVETVPLPAAEPVAVVEPVTDGSHDGEPFVVTPVDTEPYGESDHTGHEVGTDDLVAVPVAVADEPGETSGDLKPGDVPVTPVAGFFATDAVAGLRDRWREAQLGFIDDPRKAVDDVKTLVSEAVDQFTSALSAQRDELDAAAGEDTEQYRVAVQRYRAFFDRLLGL